MRNGLASFINKAFGVKKIRGVELNFNCPKCGHDDFHFSTAKLIGHCFRGSCHYSPTLEDLIDLAGYTPDELFLMPDRLEEPKLEVKVELPGTKLCFYSLGTLMTHSQEAMNYLLNRGLTVDDIIRWGITFDGVRVYVPVMKEGVLHNYVGRDITGTEERKYLYGHGVKTSHWLFGWDECKEWGWISLVENTFNSILYRNDINCTTNFGSYLSETQLDLIKKSKIKTVVLLWDESTHQNAEKEIKRLRQNGLFACYCWMKGQPDDWKKEQIIEIAKHMKNLAEQNIIEYDPFNIKKEMLRRK